MNWIDFENNLYDALEERSLYSEEPGTDKISDFTELAKLITDLYHSTAISAIESGQRSILNKQALVPGKAAIQSSIVASLSLMYNSNLKANISILTPIGLATSAYWLPASSPGIINPLPPQAPAVTPSPGSTVTFTGNPTLVADGFRKAFTSYENETNFNISLRKVSKDIKNGFENHMNSITGVYTGVTSVPAPVVIPWTGLKPT